MVGIFAKLNPFKESIDKALEIVDQAVVDQDKANELKATLQGLERDVYLAELGTSTIPWVDALHKMGRQGLSLLTLIAYIFLKVRGIDVPFEELITIVAPVTAYNVIKGRGR